MAMELELAKLTAAQWTLGQTSASYESGSAGAGAISTGKGDHGGASYGSYQFSSSTGTLQEYLAQSPYGEQFLGLTPVTPKFDTKWRDLALSDPGFAKDQHDFVGRSHYGAQVSALKEHGLDLTDRGMAVQDAVWSTSVQFRDLTPGVFSKGLAEKFGAHYELSKLSDKDIVDAVQDYKVTHVATLFTHSPTLHEALKSRFASEKIALEHLADADAVLVANHVAVEHPSVQCTNASIQEIPGGGHAHQVLRQGSKGKDVAALQRSLAMMGYGHGDTPLKADGDFGPATRSAVEAFQRAHTLKADGVAGPVTAQALERATAQRSALQTVTMDHPGHPGNAMFQQALACVRTLDASHGRATDLMSHNLSGVLALAARREGLERVDQVLLSRDASRAIALQGDSRSPMRRLADVDVVAGMNMPLTQTSAEWSECQVQGAPTQQLQQLLRQSPDVPGVQPPLQR